MNTTTTPRNSVPCLEAGQLYNGAKIEQVEVTMGQVVNITFGGSPPYNISKTIKTPAAVFCAFDDITNYNSSDYSWTVAPLQKQQNLSTVGHSVVIVAIGDSNGTEENFPYYASKAYFITDGTVHPSAAASAGYRSFTSDRSVLSAFFVLFALMLPGVLSSL